MKNYLRLASALACLIASQAISNQYAKFRGETLTVSWPALGHFNAAESVIEQFERDTGITVEIEAIPYLQLRNRQINELSLPAGELDLVSWVIMWKGEYVEKGLLEPLAPYFANPSLADPDYDFRDIARPYLVSGGMVGGDKGYLDGEGAVLYGVP